MSEADLEGGWFTEEGYKNIIKMYLRGNGGTPEPEIEDAVRWVEQTYVMGIIARLISEGKVEFGGVNEPDGPYFDVQEGTL